MKIQYTVTVTGETEVPDESSYTYIITAIKRSYLWQKQDIKFERVYDNKPLDDCDECEYNPYSDDYDYYE